MAERITMCFVLPDCAVIEFIDIGSIGETVWSVCPMFDDYGKGWIEVCRSKCDEAVDIDVEVRIGESRILKRRAHLCGRETSTDLHFYIKKRNMNCTLEGGVTVLYNPRISHPSKKAAVTQTENMPSIVEKNIPSPPPLSDFLCLLDNPDSFSDATLVCSTTNILVHRNILSARSPVFAAMFKTQMQEGRDGVVDIVDMEPDVLQAMLRYIYSGQTDHLTHSLAENLLFAADKYQLEELKMICIEQLKASMDANNVFRSLVLGELHDKSLKAHAVELVCECKNFSDLEETEEWQSLLKERPTLAVEVTTAVVKYLQKK